MAELFAAIEGAGPEQQQQRKTRRAVFSTLFADVRAVANMDGAASRFVAADTPNPQLARRTFTQADAVRADTTGLDQRAAYLPARAAPSTWDGEPGYTAPNSVG